MLDLSTKKILVAGGAGFLGSHIVRMLRERGVPAENISVPRAKECDLRLREDCLRAAEGQEVIFDCAAFVGDLILRGKIPGQIFYDNLMMGVQLIEAARLAGVKKIITIGSAVEYPENAPSPLAEKDLWMGPQPFVNLSYGLAKKALLVQGQMYRKQYGLNVIHLMPTNMYGPGEKSESGYLIPSLIEKVIGAKKTGAKFIGAWGTGEPVRDALYVEDAVEGILLAAENYDGEGPVNLGTGKGVSIRELYAIVSRIAGFSGEVRWDSSKPNGPMSRVMETSQAEKLFGFKAKTSIEKGLEKTIRWHEAQK